MSSNTTISSNDVCNCTILQHNRYIYTYDVVCNYVCIRATIVTVELNENSRSDQKSLFMLLNCTCDTTIMT